MLLEWRKKKKSFLVKIMQPRAPMTAVVLVKIDDGSHQLCPIADELFLINDTRRVKEGLGEDNLFSR